MKSDAKSFLNSRINIYTPSETYHNLQTSGLLNIEHIVQHQVYYQLQYANKINWRRHDDNFFSAKNLLAKVEDECIRQIFELGSIRALVFYILKSIDALAERIKEIAIDASYGTINTEMQLFAVFTGLDGTGDPLTYFFIGGDASSEAIFQGTLTQILDQFLRRLCQAGLDPSFDGCDKYKPEWNAIQQVWPHYKVQLCFGMRNMPSKLG